jgi:hypothetical protein
MNGPHIFDADDTFTPKVRSRRSDEQVGFMHRAMRNHPRLPKPLNQLGARGVHVPLLAPGSRGAIVKTSWVTPSQTSSLSRKTSTHLNYLTAEGTSRDGVRAALHGHKDEVIDRKNFAAEADHAPHQYRVVISLLDADQLDMVAYVQRYMKQMEQDLGTTLNFAFSIHHNSNFTHAHVVINCDLPHHQTLYLKKSYYLGGMARRASELATMYLGRENAIEHARTFEQLPALEAFTRQQLRESHTDRKGELMETKEPSARVTPDAEYQRRLDHYRELVNTYDLRYSSSLDPQVRQRGADLHEEILALKAQMGPEYEQATRDIWNTFVAHEDAVNTPAKEHPTLMEATRDLTKTAMGELRSITEQYTAHPREAAKDLVQGIKAHRQEVAEMASGTKPQTMKERLEQMVAQVKAWGHRKEQDRGVER